MTLREFADWLDNRAAQSEVLSPHDQSMVETVRWVAEEARKLDSQDIIHGGVADRGNGDH